MIAATATTALAPSQPGHQGEDDQLDAHRSPTRAVPPAMRLLHHPASRSTSLSVIPSLPATAREVDLIASASRLTPDSFRGRTRPPGRGGLGPSRSAAAAGPPPPRWPPAAPGRAGRPRHHHRHPALEAPGGGAAAPLPGRGIPSAPGPQDSEDDVE